VTEAALDLADIQGNVLRGFGYPRVRHFALGVGDAAAARQFLAGLLPGAEGSCPQVTTAAHWREKPRYTLNAGFTWQGLEALGVPQQVLAAFPVAFQQGPAVRAGAPDPDYADGVGLGDSGASAPEKWILGGTTTATVHALISLYTRSGDALEHASSDLRSAFADHGVTEISHHDGAALPHGGVHFGYRDGISQPNIAGAPGRRLADMQPEAGTGDFLLGRDHVNTYGGNYLGGLPNALGDNATYGAFRILRQDVAGFEAMLDRYAQEARMDRELVAAKLMGRWRNGVPLTLSPDTPEPATPIPRAHLDRFDYAPGADHPAWYDDAQGLRCPVGAHIRRLNPRGAMAMGKPHSRRLVRRGVAYGPPYDPAQPDEAERGLLGYFICGDLEMQYEFIQRAWVNQDIAMHGLRGTREPILGLQPDTGGRFTIRTTDARDPIVLGGLPTLTDTRGSAYCLLPGVGGLRYLAGLQP
jgi:deferrochelatase/peroxidase EfeB